MTKQNERSKEIELALASRVIVGVVIATFLRYIFDVRKKPSGTFVIDLTDPAKDVCRIELDDSLNDIYYKRQMILNVKVYEDHSLN